MRRVLVVAVAAAAVVTTSVFLLSRFKADATTAQPTVVVAPAPSGGLFHNGQMVTVTIGPNSLFTPNSKVNILECADPGGTTDDLPKSVSACDGNTIQGETVLTQSDGSISQSNYPLYALPNHALGEQANWQPVCNATNKCVLYVGENQEDFTQPKVFSAPFAISTDAQSGTAAAASTTPTTPSVAATSPNTAPTTTPTSAPTTTPTTAPTTTPTSSATTTSPDASVTDPGPTALAATGPPALLIWLLVSGCVLTAAGLAGRRHLAKAGR
jgi:hypothetical protein